MSSEEDSLENLVGNGLTHVAFLARLVVQRVQVKLCHLVLACSLVQNWLVDEILQMEHRLLMSKGDLLVFTGDLQAYSWGMFQSMSYFRK